MKESQTGYQDAINFYQLVNSIYDGRWLLFFVTLFFYVSGSVYLEQKKQNFESKIVIEVPLINTSFLKENILKDYEILFYSKDSFSKWKEKNKDKLLVFNDIKNFEESNGMIFAKDPSNTLTEFSLKDSNQLIIKTNNHELISSVFDYGIFVGNLLKTQYIGFATMEINESLKSELTVFSENRIEELKSFVTSLNSGKSLIRFNWPSKPSKTSKDKIIIMSFVFAGFFSSLAFILFRKTYNMQKNSQFSE